MNLSKLFLSVLYVGFLPKAPGTYGSIIGLFLLPLWAKWGFAYLIGLSILSYFVLKQLNFENQDPQWIVIDEVIGIGITSTMYFFYYQCFHVLGIFLIFLFFRLFDIIKPFPISWIESKLQKTNLPLSVLVDDITAGIFAGICVIFAMPPVANFSF